MPLYSYECEHCGQAQNEMRTVAERERAPKCDRCSPRKTMTLVICPVRGIVKNPAAGPSKGGF
jgi:putative FmdB family regulatory protein